MVSFCQRIFTRSLDLTDTEIRRVLLFKKTFYQKSGPLTQCSTLLSLKDPLSNYLRHWSQTPFLEGHSSAKFSSNPNQTHLIELIKLSMLTRNFQAGVTWSWLELNSAELRPSRNWVWDHWFKVWASIILYRITTKNILKYIERFTSIEAVPLYINLSSSYKHTCP